MGGPNFGTSKSPARHDSQPIPAATKLTIVCFSSAFLVSVTGLLLLLLRNTGAMGVLLAIHFGFVLGLFFTLPYGKFVHKLYRLLALVKYAGERKTGTFIE